MQEFVGSGGIRVEWTHSFFIFSIVYCTSHTTSVILPLLYILAAVTRYFTTKRQENSYKKSERDAAEKKKSTV
jgi:hypothetical protein